MKLFKFMCNKVKLELSSDEALELYNKTTDSVFKELLEKNFGKDFFKPKLITDKVFDIKSLAEHLGVREDSLFLFSRLTDDPHQKYINACNILAIIAKVYNEGTTLNWNNISEYKYLPYKNFRGGRSVVYVSCGWCHCLFAGSVMYYKSAKLSEASYNNFSEIWEDYWGFK